MDASALSLKFDPRHSSISGRHKKPHKQRATKTTNTVCHSRWDWQGEQPFHITQTHSEIDVSTFEPREDACSDPDQLCDSGWGFPWKHPPPQHLNILNHINRWLMETWTDHKVSQSGKRNFIRQRPRCRLKKSTASDPSTIYRKYEFFDWMRDYCVCVCVWVCNNVPEDRWETQTKKGTCLPPGIWKTILCVVPYQGI